MSFRLFKQQSACIEEIRIKAEIKGKEGKILEKIDK